MGDHDVLFTLRNNFHLGSFQTVINEAQDLNGLGDAEQTERDFLFYRSYIALGSSELVIAEITDSSSTALQAVKLYAELLAQRKGKEEVLEVLNEWVADPACSRNPYVLLTLGMVHMQDGDYVEALKACHSGLSLEMMALCTQAYLKLDRVDKAEQQVKAMSNIDDDAAITQLATAWVGLTIGGMKVQEAQYIYQELGDKYTWTVPLYNGSAACHMKMGQWEDAEKDLLDAFNKDAKDPQTLANLWTCGLHLGKNVARYASQLKVVAPSHPYVQRAEAAEQLFSKAGI